jgi:hypothetical protein
MFDDRRIQTSAATMLAQVSVPPLPSQAIQRRIAQARTPAASRPRFYPAAIAAAAVIALLVPAVVPGLAQTLGGGIQALLHWVPPPPAPKQVLQAMQPQPVTLEEAQARVAFTIVPPAGLPPDVTVETIVTAVPGVFSRSNASWSVGAALVGFNYRRSNGRAFTLMASAYDPREAPPTKYVFEDMDTTRNGHESMVRREHYTWRNGAQVISAIAGEGISAREIVAIRDAMHGVPVREVWPPRNGEYDKMYRRLP